MTPEKRQHLYLAKVARIDPTKPGPDTDLPALAQSNAGPRPDTSAGLIEAAEWLEKRMTDAYIGTPDFQKGKIYGISLAIDHLRSLAQSNVERNIEKLEAEGWRLPVNAAAFAQSDAEPIAQRAECVVCRNAFQSDGGFICERCRADIDKPPITRSVK